MERFTFWFGTMIKETGSKMEEVGGKLQGKYNYTAHLSRHRRLMKLNGNFPSVGQGSFIAPNASVIGKVDIGSFSSIWYGTVLRGDVNNIKIGNKTNIQDRVTVHASSGDVKSGKAPLPTVIGNNVTVEAGSILHACTLEDGCKVELGSKVLDGALVGANSVVSAGSLVPPGKSIPSGELWSGSPAKFVRKLTKEEIEDLKHRAEDVYELSVKHDAEHSKTFEQLNYEKETNEFWAESASVKPLKEAPPIQQR